VAAAEFLDRSPALVRQFIAAMTEAYELANRQPQLVREVDLKYTKLPPDFINSRDIAPFGAVIDKAALERMARRMTEFGWIERVPPMTELLDAQAVAR
jgi:ABC-type nitrate/sulfonate/bicarbonate transport system substrate-binding protein